MPLISEIIHDIPTPIPPLVSRPVSTPIPVPTPEPAPQPTMRVVPLSKAEADVKNVKADQSSMETRASAPLSDAHVISREASPLSFAR